MKASKKMTGDDLVMQAARMVLRLELELEESRKKETALREALIKLFWGCGNHNCRVKRPSGMGTNGPCSCASKLSMVKESLLPLLKDEKGHVGFYETPCLLCEVSLPSEGTCDGARS